MMCRNRALPLLVLGLISGCVTASVEQIQTRPAARVDSGEWTVVLGRRHNAEYQTERDFTDCVRSSLARRLAVLEEDTFVDRMFPWFEPRTAPMNAEDLARTLADDAVARRLDETRIRYLVWIDGTIRPGDEGGAMSCAVGPGGGGCLGFLWWEKNAAYEASVWDLDDLGSLGKITIDAAGTSYVPALVVPVPLIARTDAAACESVVAQLREFLTPASDE